MPFGYQPTSQQDAFDFMVRESRKMPRQCVSGTLCALRDDKGENACYAGRFLHEREARLGGRPYGGTVRKMVKNRLWPERLKDFEDVIQRGQEIHDDADHWFDEGKGPANPETMGAAFREMATYYSLDASAVREVYPEIYQLEAA